MITRLIAQELLSLEDRVQSILRLQPPRSVPWTQIDPQLADVRIWPLLCHIGGWGTGQQNEPLSV